MDKIIELSLKLIKTSFVLQSVVLFLIWLAVWEIGVLVEYTEHASVWFPAAGFTFACMLVIGLRAFIPIMAAAIVSSILQIHYYQLPLSLAESLWAGFLFGLAHILPYWVGAKMVVRISQKTTNTPKLIVTFLLIAGLASLICTLLVLSSLVVTDLMPRDEVSKTLLPFWIGDMAGIVVLAPLFTGWLVKLLPRPQIDYSRFMKSAWGSLQTLVNKTGLNVVLIIFTMLLAHLTGSFESSFAIFFLAVTHMWIACTESPKFNVVSLAISSVLIVVLVHFFGLMDHVMVYQFAITVIAANALFGIAVPQLTADKQALEKLAFTDALTGASSRHYFQQRAELEIAQSHENSHPLTLVILDLDRFKSINDKYGHTAGDECLINVSHAVQKVLRRNDVIARLGGDEFVLLFPDLNLADTQLLVDKLSRAITALKVEETQLSASFGLAELDADETLKSLFNRADSSLYDAKSKKQ
ncbi:diguanylate cyclase [Marinicella sp. S1101]|uniref:sensor domain-containing diguanylate cyclase n=1 Tax=Marinicella marina TaxID=2996016 RepID=UPI002260A39F|nr:diguanylate cyclase [Marinicella marina]MCX7554024.1 diguanylate cyclase [Marinicella marina]MDJ1140516.1 diguanylate cyclase [Marinicella marina]